MMLLNAMIVNRTDLGHVLVSTVTLFPSWQYETLVFKRGSLIELDGRRYLTRAEAARGHDEMVEKWRNPASVAPCPEGE